MDIENKIKIILAAGQNILSLTTYDGKLPTIYRGDKLHFELVNSSGTAITLPEGGKLRICARECVRGKFPTSANYLLFAREFTSLNSVVIDSAYTSGKAAAYALSVIVVDADDSYITANFGFFELLENGYDGLFTPTEDFRDDCLDAKTDAETAAATATTKASEAAASAQNAASAETGAGNSATNAAESASMAAGSASIASSEAARAAQYANQTAQAAGVKTLQITSARHGRLYFGDTGGSLSFGTNPCDDVVTRSYFFTLHMAADWDANTAIQEPNAPINLIGDGDVNLDTGLYRGIYLRITKVGILALNAGRTVTSSGTIGYINGLNNAFGGTSATIIPAGDYTIVATANIGSASSTGKLFINGVEMGSLTKTDVTATNFNPGETFAICNFGNFKSVDFTKAKMSGAMSRIGVVNFDMSAANAPYKVADYNLGLIPPPVLRKSAATNRLLLELSDYTIARNATTNLVKDVSGNACDATVVGDVAGDLDKALAAFVDEIKTQISQSNQSS